MTTDRERIRLADDVAELASRIANHLTTRDHDGATVINRMRAAHAGQPGAQRLEGDRTTGFATVYDDDGRPVPSVSDPTGETVVNYLTSRRRGDPARLDLDALDRALRTAQAQLDKATSILATYTPRTANAADRRHLEETNTPEQRGCESCARTEVAKGVARWTPIHMESTVKGNLNREWALCRWCYDWVLTTGALPTEMIVAAHHAGKKITRTA